MSINKKEIDKYIKINNAAQQIVDFSMNNSKIYGEFTSEIKFESLIEITNRADFYNKHLVKVKEIDIEYETNILLKKINEERNRKTSRRINRIIYSSVAAVIACIAVVITYNYNKSELVVISKNIEPIVISPTIISSTGEYLTLNDNAMIEDNNQIVAFERNNILDYKIGSEKNIVIPEQELKYNTAIVPTKHTYTIILADGTKVMLNANSKLKYPTRFDNKLRVVELEGEAFFEVTKDSIPFIVNTNNTYIKVFGTKFNVNTFENGLVKTMLQSGSVGVGCDDKGIVMIKPNEVAIVSVLDKSVKVREAAENEFSGWKENNFEFIESSLVNVITNVSAWYGVDFEYNESDFKDLSITLSIGRSITLESLSEIFKEYIGITIYVIEEGRYRIEKVR